MGLLPLQNIVSDMRKVLAKNPQVEQRLLHRRVFLEDVNPVNQSLMVSMESSECIMILCSLSDKDLGSIRLFCAVSWSLVYMMVT